MEKQPLSTTTEPLNTDTVPKSLSGNHQDNIEEPSTKTRIFQHFFLVWLDLNMNELNDDYLKLLAHLRRIINSIFIFNDINQCIRFLTSTINEKAFVIVSDCIAEFVTSQIHQMSQVDSLYVFCGNKSVNEEWTMNWPKVKGIFTDVVPICELLKKAMRQCDYYSFIPISVSESSLLNAQQLNELDQSFMYTQLLKEILFEINYKSESVSEFVAYCREKSNTQNSTSHVLDNFETEYSLKTPAWWYTYPGFMFSMLNQALRHQEIDTIIKMGFFIRDLHEEIKRLHKQQFLAEFNDDEGFLFTVYRGQGMKPADLEKMKKTKGGLLSFNNFLSTSVD